MSQPELLDFQINSSPTGQLRLFDYIHCVVPLYLDLFVPLLLLPWTKSVFVAFALGPFNFGIKM